MNRKLSLQSTLALAALLLATTSAALAALPQLFVTSDRCFACHNGLLTPSGEDVSIATTWRASMMANGARDPYWQASLLRETLDHPTAKAAIEHECSACHMPMTRYSAKIAGGQGQVFAHLARGASATATGQLAVDGVSCTLCHQIQAQGLGQEASFTAGFVVDETTPLGQRQAHGPYSVDSGRMTLMRSASRFVPNPADHLKSAELCATCHTLYTHALGSQGEVLGELPEQVPYLEWRHSAYRDDKSCQDCHMPEVEQEVAISSVLGIPRQEVSRHVFRGGNFLVPAMLDDLRAELGVLALAHELERTAQATTEHLKDAAANVALREVTLSDGTLAATVVVSNLAGHKLPTAYPSRRAWLHVTVHDGRGGLIFESGRGQPNGAIAGNDNDADPARYEPHYELITVPDEVQIYEAILAASDGTVTTGLLTAVDYAKDNRLLPKGFAKATAEPDIKPRGRALADADFDGDGDRVRYQVTVAGASGPFTIRAALCYQPIGFRWAQNLGSHQGSQIDRFVASYETRSGESAVILAQAEVTR